MCWCAVKKLLAHSLHISIIFLRLILVRFPPSSVCLSVCLSDGLSVRLSVHIRHGMFHVKTANRSYRWCYIFSFLTSNLFVFHSYAVLCWSNAFELLLDNEIEPLFPPYMGSALSDVACPSVRLSVSHSVCLFAWLSVCASITQQHSSLVA